MITGAALLEMFEGEWDLSRRIDEENAVMIGHARFTREGSDVLRYREEGLLTLRNGQTIRCSRRYRFVAYPDSLLIEFDDGPDQGKKFVEIRFTGNPDGLMMGLDDHHCGQDLYTVEYRLSPPGCYETHVTVSGPQKAYRAVTRYQKS